MTEWQKKNSNYVISEVIKNDLKNAGVIMLDAKENHAVNAFNNFQEKLDKKLFCDFDLISGIEQTK